jgi:hypothetical protein
MEWRREARLSKITKDIAADLGILTTPLIDLGFPGEGAMMVARSPGKHPIRYVLEC